MPNPAPPAHPAARRRAAESPSRPGTRPVSRSGPGGKPSTSPVTGRQASPALAGVPSSWTGFGALLSGAGERAPADALTLAAVASGAGRADGRAQVDLSSPPSPPQPLSATPAAASRTVSARLMVVSPVDGSFGRR